MKTIGKILWLFMWGLAALLGLIFGVILLPLEALTMDPNDNRD